NMISCFLLMFLVCGGVSSVSVGLMCTDPVDEGTGGEKHLKFHYDPQSGVCTPFFYKGQGGNSNRFDSDEDCLRECSAKYNEMYPSGDLVCSLPMDRGDCFATIPQYYYDSVEKICRLFLYGGCRGNGNRFKSREDCQMMCLAKSGRLLSGENVPNPDQKNVDAGLIVGVVGGLVFAGAVIAAVVMFVLHKKGKKAERKPVPTNDIEIN
ncbi:putative boophilin-H2, partial [Triplophysa rosa]